MNPPGSVLSQKALWPMLGDGQRGQLKYTWKGRERSSITLKKEVAKLQYESQAPRQFKWGPGLDSNPEGERKGRSPAEAPLVKTYVGGSLLLHLGTRGLRESLSILEGERCSIKKPGQWLLSCHIVIPLKNKIKVVQPFQSFKIMHLPALRLSRRVHTSSCHSWCLVSSPLTHAFLQRRSLSWQVSFSSISFPAKEPAEFYQSFARDGKPTQHLVQQIISTAERHSGLPGCWEPLFLLPPPLRIPIDFLIGLCCHHAAPPHSPLCVHSRQKSIFLSYIEKKNWFSFFSLCPEDYLFTTNMPIKMFC